MIIFVSILTTFESSSILGGSRAWAVLKIGSSLKPNHHREFSLPTTLCKCFHSSVCIGHLLSTFVCDPSINRFCFLCPNLHLSLSLCWWSSLTNTWTIWEKYRIMFPFWPKSIQNLLSLCNIWIHFIFLPKTHTH